MGSHLPIETAELHELLRRAYGIDAHSTDYRAAEWSVGGYTITTPGGDRYYLKVQEQTPWTFAAGSRDFYLPLTRELHRLGILPHIAYPIPTLEDRLWVAFETYALILTNYIGGVTLGNEGMTGVVLAEVGGLLGRLHASTVYKTLAHPFYERFDVAFRDVLLAAVVSTPCGSPGHRWVQVALRSRADEILAHLERLAQLQSRMRRKATPPVICHTDIHGWNLMQNREGNLYIVDWDNAMLAPREHDLMFVIDNEGFGDAFLPPYEAEVGPLQIDAEALAFYRTRRVLEDAADYVVRIARGDGSPERDSQDLADMLSGLDSLNADG